ncbi:hypothetical protein [Burkholderia sp. Ac-20353]|uniref:hypothetical protein n=1 Tax=Burkholderia sp. Ac-20353 TaxID=2703894 RepID=UPI00197B2B89|nr:hypothetical protein [Burkholderia sp. Ac-20353]MBN3786109.1 hypothetical protein [Burkholderia sp. Ac-20353]
MKKCFLKTTLGRAPAALRSRGVITRRIVTGAAMSTTVHAAYAGGGLNAGTQAANNFTTWFYSFCGVMAGSYLLWVGVQCWSNKADWIHDFGGGIAKVAGVGAALVLAGWAFGLFA